MGLELDKLPAKLVNETLEALPRHDFKNAFVTVMVETLTQSPQSATLTFLSDLANEHVPGCHCGSFVHLMKASPFTE